MRAAQAIAAQGIAKPILLGRPAQVQEVARSLSLDFVPQVIDPSTSQRGDVFAEEFYQARQRKGVTLALAQDLMRQPSYYGPTICPFQVRRRQRSL